VVAAGRRARQAFLDNYDLPHGVARICALLGLAPQPLTTALIPEVLCTRS
jgi:hypothetical protein